MQINDIDNADSILYSPIFKNSSIIHVRYLVIYKKYAK